MVPPRRSADGMLPGGGRAAGGGAPAWHGGCAPARALARTRGDRSAAAAPLLLLLLLVLRGAARHGQPLGTRREKWVPVPSPAPTGCGSWLREEEEEEGGKEGGGREEGRGGGDAALGKRISPLSGRSRLPAPSEGAQRRYGDSLYLPKTQRWLLKRDPAASLAPLPSASPPPPPWQDIQMEYFG